MSPFGSSQVFCESIWVFSCLSFFRGLPILIDTHWRHIGPEAAPRHDFFLREVDVETASEKGWRLGRPGGTVR